ncbi:MAG: cytochrome c biogenesis protein CcsA [Chloroflexi bacterium]|nr:cytochrome c biogenesis protein CcsA [Chloroflexota bacterium]
MWKMSIYFYGAAFISLGIATLLYLVYAYGRVRLASLVGGGFVANSLGVREEGFQGVQRYATILTVIGLVFLTLCLVFRTVATGHGPFSNMYEFSLAFAWGILAVYLYFLWRHNAITLGVLAIPMVLAMLWYAGTLPSEIQPLVPALQNNLLLSLHVSVAIIAYGASAIAFATAMLFMVQVRAHYRWLPPGLLLEDLGYRSVIIGFPLLALTIILGAVWADQAWGRFWGWDPKETASLVTWLIYGGYLHARAIRGWRGTKSALLLVMGFAAVLVTYFGNYFLGGLHSYGGLG